MTMVKYVEGEREMKAQEICDFLATELMGWLWSNKLNCYVDSKGEIVRDRTGIAITSKIIELSLPHYQWNPLEDADDCLECVKKLGEMGLGEQYAIALYAPTDDAQWLDCSFVTVYRDLLTAPLKTQCEAMVKVLKERL